jgi:hypothetical protein
MTPGPRPISAVAAGPAVDPTRLDGTNINPVTLLATDFLNHFNEAIMLLEMLPMAPDCKDDFLAWRPMSYPEHFAASNFKHRDLAIAVYEMAADTPFRCLLDEISDQMNLILTETRAGLEGDLSHDTIRILAEATTHWLKPLVARAGSVINGELAEAQPATEAAPQDAIDALFDQAVETVCQA